MSLPIVLMFLLVTSLLASVGIRRATLGEAMSRNQIELETARQAAEAALRDAERDLRDQTGTLRTNALCARGAERPTRTNLVGTFNSTCLRGQCYFDQAYYLASRYQQSATDATTTNPQPWWPTSNSKGGLWNNTFADKPSDVAGTSTNCTFNGAVPLGTFTGSARIAAVARQPEYLIELFSLTDDTFMRVTARGFGTDQNTEVVMQSYFRAFRDLGGN
jgi:type IV pilus assembly protein PilX